MKARLGGLVLTALLATAPFQIGCSDDDDENFGGVSQAGLDAEGTFDGGEESLDPLQSAIFDGLGGASDGTDQNALTQHLANALVFLLEGPDQFLKVLAAGSQTGEVDGFSAGEALFANLSFFVQELLCAIGEGTGGVCVEPGQVPDEVLLNLLPSLQNLQAALDGDPGGADLSVVLFHLRRLAEGLAESMAYLDDSVNEAPILEPLFAMLSQASLDIADLLDTIMIVGGGDGDMLAGLDANHALRVALENLLVNLFTEVIPLAEQDPATAEEVIAGIQDGLDQLEEFTEALVVPIIDQLIDPVTDIIGPILDGLLHSLGIEG